MKKLAVPYQLMFLIAMVLAVYYPTQFAEINLIDDVDAIGSYLAADEVPLEGIFFPRSFGGGYYRPLIGFSYWLDKRLWFLDEHLMHFEGVIAHLINALLLFLVCREAVSIHLKERMTYIPFVAALLFSLHPICTESVNWISGRTDIMMGNYVLLSVFLLFRYRLSRSKLLLILSQSSALVALLAKEAAFGYLLGFPLLLMHCPGADDTRDISLSADTMTEVRLFGIYYLGSLLSALFLRSFGLVLIIAFIYFLHIIWRERYLVNCEDTNTQIQKRICFLLSAFVVTVVLFVFVRKIAFSSDINKIGQTLRLMGSDINYSISLFLGACGFYMKKFLLPFPLNFFIVEIDPLYDFIGISVLLIALRLFISCSLPSIMSLVGLFLMLPALPFAFGTIAWTAYAERYIYLSSAFWIIALSLWIGEWLRRDLRRIPFTIGATIVISIVAAGATFTRNRVWQTNVSLLRDTVASSPNNRNLREIYMYALLRAGYVKEAKQEYRIAQSVRANIYDERADLIMGGQLQKEGHYSEALQLYQGALQQSKFESEMLLAAAVQLVRQMNAGEQSLQERHHLSMLEHDYARRLRKKSKNPRRLIDEGKNALQGGSFAEAASLFDRASQNMSKQDKLYTLAVRLRDEARKK